MFDPMKFGVSDLTARFRSCFLQALAPPGARVLPEGPPSYGVGIGTGGGARLSPRHGTGFARHAPGG